MYTSPDIRNDIINICGVLVKPKIIQKVNAAECFFVLTDETTGIGKVKQMSVCVHYYDKKNQKNDEDFLEFIPAIYLSRK